MSQKNLLKQANEMMKKPRDVGFLTKVSMYLITVFLCLGLIILSQGIKHHYVKELEINANNLAKGYSHSLSRSVEASAVVEQLIHDKLKGLASIITNTDADLQNEDLVALSTQMNVDEIAIYNQDGILMLSNIERFVGWNPPLNHPVRDFMNSDLSFYIEPIRANTITGDFYLYGYEKMEDGRTVQVGIDAQKVNTLIGGFHMNSLLKEMLTHDQVEYVNYVSSEGIILGSSRDEEVGKVTVISERKPLSDTLNIGEFQLVPMEEIHDFHEPVYLSGTEAGTLLIGMSLEETRNAIRNLTRSMTVVLLMIYLAAIIVIYLLHDKTRKLFDLAYEDDITRLPNAKYLKRMLRYELKQSRRDQLALIMVHVPRFSRITMTKGHERGESILQDIAKNISARAIEGASLFRFSEEKFMMLVRNYGRREMLVSIMENLSQVIPLQGDHKEEKRYNTLAFGALELGEQYNDEVDVLKDVLIALNNVSEDAPKPYIFFDEVMEMKILRETAIESELKMAIESKMDNIILLTYQPLIDAKTETIIGLEALTRMNSQKYGMISPLEFIQIAEKNGLMPDLGRLILEKAVDFEKKLLEEGYGIRVAVNISPIQVIQDDFVSMVRGIIEYASIDPSFIELEITESVFLSSYDLVNRKLKVLREMGLHISIDDFGTGYSSFARLKELHVDSVKIDQYFIRKITQLDPSDLITGDIIRMVHKSGLSAVAEGVETKEERDYLIREGCDVLQGYYYSKPMQEKDALRYVRKQSHLR
ncbi:EAL domain-containing protein [Proteiniclasticum sp. SCR006]|uniref:EAL domain-containing protein n=1 Tax=Proteiniclasticum aestuarii TaxID=2817862 RepID=A0A939HCY0_9CLOT|nr:GGDEF domain-containing phosphodiesterase [Proteiniclasticum aestuarii]MBO1266035.1 EAL domain-containing protein [Proteiniclasticum aestuarii]